MRFFLPDWDDRVDPTFDFAQDQYTTPRTPAEDQYAHEVLASSPYDGLLVSRAIVEDSPSSYASLLARGARDHFRLKPSMRIFGDCGAFSYVNDENPRYATDDVVDYYDSIGVNYGASVDHLVFNTLRKSVGSPEADAASRVTVVGMDVEERQRRVDLTIVNAAQFLRLHRRRRFSFVPVGVAQGWDERSYADSVTKLIRVGYRYIAIGGLARSTSRQVLDVLRRVVTRIGDCRGVVPRDIRLHLFGVAKMPILRQLARYRVASVDSASYLRKAWLRSGQNYLASNGTWYTAIRIPQSGLLSLNGSSGISAVKLEAMERACLEGLNRIANDGLSTRETKAWLERVLEYDGLLKRRGQDGHSMLNGSRARSEYWRTLLAEPWGSCPCGVCSSLGPHVVVFRGANRNKRRGFHNTWIFFQLLRKASGR